jgi:hypothetical protein
MTKQFNASTQRGLCVNRQLVRVQQHNGFEHFSVGRIQIGFCKVLQVFSNKPNTASVRAIYSHHMCFNDGLGVVVNGLNKIRENRVFSTPVWAMKYDIWNFFVCDKVSKLCYNIRMQFREVHIHFIKMYNKVE